MEKFEDLEITNKCVVVCDLSQWTDSNSSSWESIKGDQEEVGIRLAEIIEQINIERIDDFGGVCKTFLCENEKYLETPPKIKGNAGVFSFTPKNKMALEAQEMARVTSSSGYKALILTVQKHKKYGKVWVLSALLKNLHETQLIFYEDTSSVIDELKQCKWGKAVNAIHVQAPGYEAFISSYADKVISQQAYKNEVLLEKT